MIQGRERIPTKSRKTRIALPVALLLTTLACNIGVRQPATSPLDAAATIVAMTLQAQGLATSPASTATITASPVPATATTKPTLRINTNNATCRSGPSPDSKEIASFASGTTVDMIAKDTADGYWLVKDPASGSSCWVQVQDATPSGSFDLLPEVTPQVSVQKPPGAPGRVNYSFTCYDTSLTTTLDWSAPAGAVNGYRVYRLGSKVADLAANATTYTETTDFTIGSSMSYAVEAYNDAGASPQLTWNFKCP